ncbi:hypothetical protein KHC28_06975 [Ancylobacter sonchi]|uniref:hypothetical protein n=1 Tax=Ancylobacter sonchi TaxID=1937790 RepID=UPI001BD32F94|nr:hypothetical protein [Ancylobacter sonchi]MBS7533395.1 hypothetical protein [Ancylobacter sonchi]
MSNSAPKLFHIEVVERSRNLANIPVVTADMNVVETDERFDRIVSVKMVGHMA